MFDEFGFPGDPDEDATAPTLYTFVYCSRAAEGVDDAEVDRLIESAQRHNHTCGITGVLVFGSGVFFQWIEGPTAEVRKLIARLHADPRHHDIVSLDQSEERRERLYPDWQMERVEADDLRDVLEDALDSTEDEHNIAALKRILDHLASGPLESLGRPPLSEHPQRDDRPENHRNNGRDDSQATHGRCHSGLPCRSAILTGRTYVGNRARNVRQQRRDGR